MSLYTRTLRVENFNSVLSGLILLLIILSADALPVCTQDSSALQVEEAEGPNPWTHLEFANCPSNFQFAVISDLTAGLRPGIFESAVRNLNLMQPEFVMCVGDLI